MSMRTKYKLGDRVIFTDEQGFENYGVIQGIAITHDLNGMLVTYRYNKMCFSDDQVVGRVVIQKPRKSRGQKKVDELKKMARNDSGMAAFLVSASESAA